MKTNKEQLISRGCYNRFAAILTCVLILIVQPLRASIVAWGTNDYGQLNLPTSLLTGARSVASGYWHGVAVTASQTVAAWGVNDYGQTNIPSGLSNILAVAAGQDHCLALRTNGTVVGWGITSNLYSSDSDWFGQADVPADVTNATAISAGALHSMALKSDGTVRAWGYDFYGQCNVPAGLSNVTAISCGGYFSMALKSDGTVVAWGDNYYGQTNVPSGLSNVVAIAAGGLHALALKSDGTVVGWGARGVTDFSQDFGQQTVPGDLTNATSISAGFFHSLAVQSNGAIRQWGDTSQGQLSPPANLTNVVAVAGGYAHSFALITDAPYLLSQPTNVMTITNLPVTFAVEALGAWPVQASWWRGDTLTKLGTALFTNTNNGTINFAGGNLKNLQLTNRPGMQFTLNLLSSYSALSNAGTATFYLVLTNSFGTVTSSVATLTVTAPPKITSQPVSIATNSGATVFFGVGVSGSAPLSCQWLFNGTPLSLVNPSNILELDNVTTSNTGNYQLVITNSVGSVTSSVVTLTVDGPPVITTQPANTNVNLGDTAIFTAAANGTGSLAYQWYFFQTNTSISSLAGGTNASYTQVNAQTNNAGSYFLVVSNPSGSVTSTVATLSLSTSPLLLTQPTNVVTATNLTVNFGVQANGGTPMRVTWWRSGFVTNLGTFTYTNPNSVVTANFATSVVSGKPLTNNPGMLFTMNLTTNYTVATNVGNNYTFYVVISNSLGSVTSSAAVLSVLLPPKITSQPVNVATNVGSTVFLTMSASGSPTLSYQWYFNNAPLSLTSPTNILELDNVTTNNAGNYQVVVANAVGSVTSSVVTLSVDGSPVITAQPTNLVVNQGSNTTFTATAQGANPLVYQWYYYQTNTTITPLSDGTNASYALVGAQTNNAGNYFLMVSNAFGSVTSSVASLTVLTPPILLSQPTNVLTATNRPVNFAVQVSGLLPMRAFWWRTDNALTNFATINYTNTNSTTTVNYGPGTLQAATITNGPGMQFTLNLTGNNSALTNAGNYSYYIVLTNSLGSVTSSVGTLTVMLPPKITNQPVNTATNAGSTVLLSVGASGSQPMSYQWFKNSTPLSVTNATNTLELDNVTTNDTAAYQVVITNAVGSTTSSSAYLTVLVNGSLTPPQLWLLNHNPNGDQIMIALEAGKNYRIQASTNLSTWSDVTNFLSQSSLIMYTNTQFTNMGSQYYRVVTP